MPTFEYDAIRTEGEGDDAPRSFMGGVVVAKSRSEAKEKLRRNGLKAHRLRRTKGVVALLRWFDADIR